MLDHPSRAVFKARAHTSFGVETVVVKFAYTYSREGHNLLAQSDPPLAPRLWFCEKVESIGMYVVVMDFVASQDCGMSAAERTSLRDAVELLHTRDLVFGDLRDPNVLRCPGGGVFLIDFDWCGKVGEARYPSDINLNKDYGMPWHKDVRRRGLIEKEHDMHLLEALLKSD